MSNLPASSDESAKRPSALARFWEILNRDIGSFKRGATKGCTNEHEVAKSEEPIRESLPPQSVEPAVASEVDTRHIDRLRFRREVMDWRDGYHFAVTREAILASGMLADVVKMELNDSSVLRRVLAKTASEVLESQIESCIELAIRRKRHEEEEALRKNLLRWFPGRHIPAMYPFTWPKLEWDARLVLKFKASNLSQIQAVLNDLILGDKGLAAVHRDWATRFANQVLEMRDVEPDSV